MGRTLLTAICSCIIAMSCGRQAPGRDLPRLGFYYPPERIIEKLKDVEPGFREHYMLGLAHKELKQHRNAIFHFANSAFVYERKKNLRIFAGPVYQFADEFHIKSDYYDDAMYELAGMFYLFREYDHVVKFVDLMDRQPTALYRDAAVLKSRALCELKKFDLAAESINALLPEYPQKSSQALLRIRLASTWNQAGDSAKALEEYFRVIDLDPESWRAGIAAGQITEILKATARALTPAQKLSLGKALYHARSYSAASAIISEALSAPSLKEGRDDATIYLIKSYVRERRLPQAQALVAGTRKRPDHHLFARAEADTLWFSGQKAAAVQKYRVLASSSTESAKDALKRVVLYTEERKLPGFQDLLREYMTRFPGDENSDLFSWLLARSYIRARDFSSALPVITAHLAGMPDGKYSDHMRFWLYKISTMKGERDTALSALRDMTVKNPDSSYTWILLDLLSRDPVAADAGEKLRSCDRDECRQMYHALLTLGEKDLAKRDVRIRNVNPGNTRAYNDFESRIAGPSLSSDSASALRRLKKYFEIGNIDAVNREVSALPDDDDTTLDTHTALAHFAGRYGNHYLSAYSTVQLLNALKIDTNLFLMHRDTIRRLYPEAFPKCVKKYSEKYTISRATLYAVIRSESFYNNEALSPAGAVGLMQLMPATARAIARELGESSYNLKKPCTSVKYGAHNLAWLDKTYGGKIELMIAAYNAGPGNLQKWREKFNTDDIHLFTELVPFDETRYYMLRTKKNLLQGELAYGK